jgi:signal transduction histidine kinase
VGTGLGLAIVHELVEAMGGTVQAVAGAGGGTRVVVSLPAWPADPPVS